MSGALSDGWQERPVSACLAPFDIGTGKKVFAREYKAAGRFPVVDQGQQLIAGYTDDESALIAKGLPLIVFGDHTRVFKFVDFPFVIGADGTKLLKPVSELDPRFFYFSCLTLDIENRGYNRHFKVLREQVIRCPPLPEQKKIASVLGKVQEAIELEAAQTQAARDLKKSLLRQLFTHGLRNERLEETEVGLMPESWRVLPLKEIAVSRGGFAFPHERQGRKNGDFPFYKVSDMNLFGNETFLTKANNWVQQEDLTDLGAKPYPELSVVFPKVGGALLTNKKRMLTRPSAIDNNMMAVVVRDASVCLPHYLFQWFLGIDIGRLANPGPLPSLNASRLGETLVPLPPLKEQQKLVDLLRVADERVAVHEAKQRTLQDLFKTLLHQLMTAQVRVHDLDIPMAEEAR